MNDDPHHSGLREDHAGDSDFTPADLEYDLPPDRIAQHPRPKRDDSRLLIVDRKSGDLQDAGIIDLPRLLHEDDLLILNDTLVLPARLHLRRATGGRVGGLFIRDEGRATWRLMLEGSRRLRVGERLTDEHEAVIFELLEYYGEGFWRVRVREKAGASTPPARAIEILERIGLAPLPPYIRRKQQTDKDVSSDRERYQTVYARKPGAIAAPTAGLHLSNELLAQLHERGLEPGFVTLHVGVGTFKSRAKMLLAPARDRNGSADDSMHAEWFEVSSETAEAVRRCRRRGGRVVAVGTTTVRALESAARKNDPLRRVEPASGVTDLFLYPPCQFRVVDALLTNFHLPKTTLLALVMAMAGKRLIRRAYAYAIDHGYRFYSYGDAMLIL